MQALLNRITGLYPLWLVLFASLGFWRPETLSWFSGQWITWAITTVMLGMGFTLTFADFHRLLKMPGLVILGFVAQYTIMPLAGWLVVKCLNLEAGVAIGIIIVASCPAGTASNLITYLARANVALSVILTLSSTLMAFIMTPLWCKTLAGAYLEVDAWGLCRSTVQAVVIPLFVGVLCNWRFPKTVARISIMGPLVSVVALAFITGGIVAQSADVLAANAGKLTVAVLMLHGIGFVLGYVVTKLLGYSEITSRTLSIEVGMQNGGMAAMLAKKHFVMEPMAAVPAVFSALMQNLIGALVAAYWRARPAPPDKELDVLTEEEPEKVQS